MKPAPKRLLAILMAVAMLLALAGCQSAEVIDNTEDKIISEETDTVESEVDAIEDEPVEEPEDEESEAENVVVEDVAVEDISTAITSVDESYTDYFIWENGVYYVNTSIDSSWQEYTFTKGEYFGEILSNTTERDLSIAEPASASVLPVGTQLYFSNEDKTIVLAEVDGELIPYVEIVEG